MTASENNFPRFNTPPWMTWFAIGLAPPVLSLVLVQISDGTISIQGFVSFLVVLSMAAGLLVAGWILLKNDSRLMLPRWLGWAVFSAVLLRLIAGVLWSTLLPVFGYGSPAEQAGYIMADAYHRDQAAWDLARSGKPLQRSFAGYDKADQYGGLLFISALIYRYVGGGIHRPLLVVILAAAASSLGVMFTWSFARRAWDENVAKIAALVLVIYPEALLLGSSQMREAFTMSLAIAGFYGLVRYWQDRMWAGLVIMVVALVICMPFSPPFAALLLGTLVVQAVIMDNWKVVTRRNLWLVLGLLAILAGFGLWLAWSQFAPEEVSNPVALVSWWMRRSAEWQARLSERASGWLQRVFEDTPAWFHAPFLVSYGVVRPFLPAALLESTIPIWRVIAIWRAVGWTVLLALILYAPVQFFRNNQKLGFLVGLMLVVWLVILTASLRGGGDLWDNPRYRASFVGLQVALASWVWAGQQQRADPWLRRMLVGFCIMLLWFIPWYLRRYTPIGWVVVDLFKTIGLGVSSAVLFIIWDWTRSASPTSVEDKKSG